jgi:hypothetical protein
MTHAARTAGGRRSGTSWARARGLAALLTLAGAACHVAAPPVTPVEASTPASSHVLGLGRKPDRRFIYVVKPDGVYAMARPVDSVGRPVFARAPIKVASIEPALDANDRRVVDRDGDLVPARGAEAASASAAHKLVVLVPDPASVAPLDVGPRSKDEFLALDDRTLVDYASAWLRYRDGAGEGATLTDAERDVLLASLAFAVVADDGFSGLLALRPDDLPAIGDSLRRLQLDSFAEVVDRASALALAGKQSESGSLDALWHKLEGDPVPRLAAYIRAHADEIDWSRMQRK